MQEPESFSLDTHTMVKDLIAAGFTEKQAEAHVSTLSGFIRYNLATKADVAKIERDIAELRKETKTDIETLRKETKTEIANVRKDIELMKRDLTIRMGGIMAVGVGIIVALSAFVMTRVPPEAFDQ